MKVVITIGSDLPRPKTSVPLVKLALLGLGALAIMSRHDIRRYLRLRNM